MYAKIDCLGIAIFLVGGVVVVIYFTRIQHSTGSCVQVIGELK